MKYLKLYESFNPFGINNKMNPDEFFSHIKKNYKKLVHKLGFDVSDDFISYGDNFVSIREKDGKYLLINMNDESKNQELSEEEFDYYMNIIKITEEEYNKMEEEKMKSKKPSIDSSGNLVNTREENLNTLLSDYVGKEYSYEVDVVKWTSNSENTRNCETVIFTNNGFNMGKRGENDLYIEVFVDCSLDDEEYSFLVDSNSIDEYVDLENHKGLLSHTMMLSKTKKQTRREMNTHTFPSYSFFNTVPNKYETIEFIKQLKNIIEEANRM